MEQLNKQSIDTAPINTYSCPHCSSTSIFRNGHKNGKQQYKCKKCNKSFQSTTGTPIHGLHLTHKIAKYTQALMQGMSVRAAANFVKISKNTSFFWRHKFLSSIPNEPLVKENQTPSALAIIKTPYSDKGRKKLPEKNISDSKTLISIENNQINIKKLNNKTITKQIIQIISTKDVIYTAKSRELKITQRNVFKKQVLQQKKLKNYLQIKIKQQINYLENWMKRFRGVATKYLQQYWNWYCGLHNIKSLKNDSEYFNNLCIHNKTLHIYRKLVIQ